MPSVRARPSALISATPSQGSFACCGESSAELRLSEIRVRVGARSIIVASPGDCTVILPLPVRERFETRGVKMRPGCHAEPPLLYNLLPMAGAQGLFTWHS